MVKLFLVGLVFVSFAESYLFPGNDISLVHVVKKLCFQKPQTLTVCRKNIIIFLQVRQGTNETLVVATSNV